MDLWCARAPCLCLHYLSLSSVAAAMAAHMTQRLTWNSWDARDGVKIINHSACKCYIYLGYEKQSLQLFLVTGLTHITSFTISWICCHVSWKFTFLGLNDITRMLKYFRASVIKRHYLIKIFLITGILPDKNIVQYTNFIHTQWMVPYYMTMK